MSEKIALPNPQSSGLGKIGTDVLIYWNALSDAYNGIDALTRGEWDDALKHGFNGLGNVAAPFLYPVLKEQYDQIQQGERDTALNIESEIEFKRAKQKFMQDLKLAGDDPNRVLLAKHMFNNKVNRILPNFDPNTKYQQLKRAKQQQQPAKAVEENTEESIAQAPTGLAKIVQQKPASNKSNRIRYSDVDLNSEQSRQIINSADMKRSMQDYANRSDLSDEEKQIRAIADVMAYNLNNNRTV